MSGAGARESLRAKEFFYHGKMRLQKRQLADHLIGTFRHLASGELPSRAIRYEPKTRRAKAGQREDWGSYPVALVAVDELAQLRMAGSESIELRVGDALLMTGRQYQELKPGGRGILVGFEALGSQPCRFFELDRNSELAAFLGVSVS